MAFITYRREKGSRLTPEEVDNNFANVAADLQMQLEQIMAIGQGFQNLIPLTVGGGKTLGSEAIAEVGMGLVGSGFQWYRNAVPISGATSKKYMLAYDDMGKAISCTVQQLQAASMAIGVPYTAMAPVLRKAPVPQNKLVNEIATFTAQAIGYPEPQYQWQKDGVPINGANAAVYSTERLALADAGTIGVTATNEHGEVWSGWMALNVSSLPVFNLQPLSQTTMEGSALLLTCEVNASPAPTLQWMRNGMKITGATQANYTIPGLTPDNTGDRYTVVASNRGGATISAAAAITVERLPTAPNILVSPGNQTRYEADITTFLVVASGWPSPTFQWFKNGVAIEGATQASYTTAILSVADHGANYTVMASNDLGNRVSAQATLTVEAEVAAAPVAAAQFTGNLAGAMLSQSLGGPGGTDVTVEALIRFDGALTGAAYAISLPFTINDSGRSIQLTTQEVWPDAFLAGGDSTTGVSRLPSQPEIGKWYLMSVSVGSAGVGEKFTFQELADVPGPFVKVERPGAGVDVVSPAGAIAINGGGSGPGWNGTGRGFANGISVQYVRGFLGQRTDAQIQADLKGVDPTDTDFWWVFKDDGQGGVLVTDATGNNKVPTLRQAVLVAGPTVKPVLIPAVKPPTITKHPISQKVGLGDRCTLTVEATGAEPMVYSWRKNGVDIPGTDSATYPTPAIVEADMGAQYDCMVINQGGSKTSQKATLTVVLPAPGPLAQAAPRVLLNDVATLNGLKASLAANNPPARRLRDMVQAQMADATGNYAYNFQAYFAALMFRLTDDQTYAQYAHDWVMENLTAEETLIAAGANPRIAKDSYLEIGGELGDMLLVLDWCRDKFSPTEIERIITFGNQAVNNVWNHLGASWNGRNAPWSGWSVDNPSNNYFYSFIQATMLMGLVTYGDNPQAQKHLNTFYSDKVKILMARTFARDLPGGGSREGTGYGMSIRSLWKIYMMWEKSTGVNITDVSTHTINSAYWMLHSMVPGGKFMTPLGDHARESTGAFYDYHRELLLGLLPLHPTDAGARAARSMLVDSGYLQMRNSFNFVADFLYEEAAIAPLPMTALYPAFYDAGTGHISARTGWDAGATYVHQNAGPFTESHAHRDQGHFVIWRHGWLLDDANIRSSSGLSLEEFNHNVVRYVGPSGVVTQVVSASPSEVLALFDNAHFHYAVTDSTPVYSGKAEVIKSQRELVFIKPGCVVVFDRAVVNAPSVARVFTMNMSTAPSIAGHTFVLNKPDANMSVTRVAPAGLPWATVAYTPGGGYPLGGARMEAASSVGTETLFLHTIDVMDTVTASVADNAAGQTGCLVSFVDGSTVLVRFNHATTGGTLKLTTSTGEVLYDGLLPATVQTPPLLA